MGGGGMPAYQTTAICQTAVIDFQPYSQTAKALKLKADWGNLTVSLSNLSCSLYVDQCANCNFIS